MKDQGTFERDGYETLRLTTDATVKYTVAFLSIGATIEFVALAGQSFIVSGKQSDIEISVDQALPAVAGGGLQLVPAAPKTAS